MMGILGYEIPALLKLLQEIGIEQMGASLFAKGLVSEADGFLVYDGMEETREEGTAKDAVGLLELDNRGIVRGKEHVKWEQKSLTQSICGMPSNWDSKLRKPCIFCSSSAVKGLA